MTTTLIARITPMPLAEGLLAEAFIMKLENGKKFPPIRTEPSRAIR